MTFEKITNDSECDCLNKSSENTTNEFIRKLGKPLLEDKDFVSYWERNKRPLIDDCKNICSFKGISMNLYKNEYEEQILNKYKTTMNINPKKGSHYLKFKLLQGAGNVKHTPEENDTSHHDFFKSDDFKLENITVLEIVKFA